MLSGEFIIRAKNGIRNYETARMIKRNSDGMFVYCVEPFQKLINNWNQEGMLDNPEAILNISKQTWRRVGLLAYYGYQYQDHSDLKWYIVTQILIWRTVDPNADFYFTHGLDGARWDDKYSAEINELERLVSEHFLLPNFNVSGQLQGIIGQPLNLYDSNNVISKYDITSDSNVTISKNGNQLTIIPNSVGKIKLNLENSDKLLSTPPILYASPDSQDVLVKGKYDPISYYIDLNVIGGAVTIHKQDKDTLKFEPQGNAFLSGALYGVYKEDGTKVTEIITNELGEATSSPLPFLGRGYVQEIEASEGYRLDNTKYYFEITEENMYPSLNVQEDVIDRKINIFKVFASDQTGFLTGESNVQFDIYLKSTNKFITSIITDEKGKASTVLAFGTYIVKQVTATQDHHKVDDFEITITEDKKEDMDILLSNSEIQAKLKVVKIDSETKKAIPRKGIKFKIFNVEKNEYVCQSITYPTVQNVCVFETDENGEFITPYNLKSGRYRLEEIEQKLDGYLWNPFSHEFIIGEDTEIITDSQYGIIFETRFENQPVKGKVTIEKKGEKLVFNNNSFFYQEILLDGVVYSLYAEQDIISGDGTIIYKKNELIGEYETKNGYILLDNLYLGDYCLIEQATVNGHILDKNKHCFSLKYKDQYTPIVSLDFTFKNYLEKGKLEFTKTDFVTSEALPNTKIQIYDADKNELIFEGVTDVNGKIIIDNLYVGSFYLIELEAPENYLLSTEKKYFQIKENNEIVKANMTNIKVPDTKLNDNSFFKFVICSLLLAGMGTFIYVIRNKK